MSKILRIALVTVKSSCISYVGYDSRGRRIVVQWKKGGSWWAYPATFREYVALLKAESVGVYVNTYLINRKGAAKLAQVHGCDDV